MKGSHLSPAGSEVPEISSWLQCFYLYVAVVGVPYPKKARELLAYQALLVAEHR